MEDHVRRRLPAGSVLAEGFTLTGPEEPIGTAKPSLPKRIEVYIAPVVQILVMGAAAGGLFAAVAFAVYHSLRAVWGW